MSTLDAGDARSRLKAVQSRVRTLARENARVADAVRAAFQEVAATAVQCELERQAMRTKVVSRAREILASGRLRDPDFNADADCEWLHFHWHCPTDLATRLGQSEKGGALPESLEREAAASALEALNRDVIYQAADPATAEAMAEQHRAWIKSGTHVHTMGRMDVVRPGDWVGRVSPLTRDPEVLSRLDEDEYRTIALYRLGGLADLGYSRPIVPLPPDTGGTAAGLIASAMYHMRAPTDTNGGLDVAAFPPDLAEEMLAFVEMRLCRGGSPSNAGSEREEPGTQAPRLPTHKYWAFEAWKAKQVGMTVTEIAATLAKKYKDPKITQPRVSEQIKLARVHAEASGLADDAAKVFPQVESRAPARTIDPAVVDQGKRSDGAAHHLRERERHRAKDGGDDD